MNTFRGTYRASTSSVLRLSACVVDSTEREHSAGRKRVWQLRLVLRNSLSLDSGRDKKGGENVWGGRTELRTPSRKSSTVFDHFGGPGKKSKFSTAGRILAGGDELARGKDSQYRGVSLAWPREETSPPWEESSTKCPSRSHKMSSTYQAFRRPIGVCRHIQSTVANLPSNTERQECFTAALSSTKEIAHRASRHT